MHMHCKSTLRSLVIMIVTSQIITIQFLVFVFLENMWADRIERIHPANCKKITLVENYTKFNYAHFSPGSFSQWRAIPNLNFNQIMMKYIPERS